MKTSFRTVILAALLVLQIAVTQGWIGKGVISGPRDVTIYYETLHKTPEFNRLILAFREGAAAAALKEKGTYVEFADASVSAPPDPTLALPAMYVYAGETELYKTTVTDVAPASVLKVIQSHGG